MEVKEQSLAAVAAEWERLAEQVQAPPFLLPGWFEAWSKAFGSGELRILTASEGGRLVGVLPILRRRAVIVSPTNWHSPLYGPVVKDADVAGALYEYLIDQKPRRLALSFIDSRSPGFDRLATDQESHVELILESPYLPIEGDWETLWRSRSKNLRSTVRRCRNRLADLGPVELDVVTGRGDRDLKADLEAGFGLEDSGWKQAEGTSIDSRPETRRFYEEIAHWAADRGILRLAFLRVGGRPVAFNYCFEADGIHYLVKLGHDFRLHKFGPGTVLTAMMVERAFAEKLKSYEFLGGPDPYKLRWSELRRERMRVQRFAGTVPGQLQEIFQVHGRRAAKRLVRR